MRVVHVVHGKANPASHNGISRVVYHLNKQEKLQGCQSEIWALVDDAKSHYTHVRDEFVTVECYPRVRLPFGRHQIIDELISNKESIDLVHFHLIWFFDKNIMAKALKKAGIPFIITTHGTYSKDHAYTGKRLLAKWLYEVDYLNMATEVHAITREEGTGLQKYGYPGKSFVAYNGIDLDEIPGSRQSNYFSGKPYAEKDIFLWIGVLRADKNLESLIRAVAMLPADIRSKFVCVFVGPDYKNNAAQYTKLAKSLGCAQNFDYIGPLYGEEKYLAIESADAYVMPSISEVFSLATLDAMACAKPCLISSGCGYNYFIDHDFFVPCEPYAQDIARGVQELYSRRNDWLTMGKNGRELIENELNWAKIAAVMIDNYQRITQDQNNVV